MRLIRSPEENTIELIASHFGITAEDIRRMNGLGNQEDVRFGKELRIKLLEYSYYVGGRVSGFKMLTDKGGFEFDLENVSMRYHITAQTDGRQFYEQIVNNGSYASVLGLPVKGDPAKLSAILINNWDDNVPWKRYCNNGQIQQCMWTYGSFTDYSLRGVMDDSDIPLGGERKLGLVYGKWEIMDGRVRLVPLEIYAFDPQEKVYHLYEPEGGGE